MGGECSPQSTGGERPLSSWSSQAGCTTPFQLGVQIRRSGFWQALAASQSSGCFALLPQENHKLRDQNDDLNGQILSLSLYEAKNLFATQTKAQSLAAEIDTASRDEVALSPHSFILSRW